VPGVRPKALRRKGARGFTLALTTILTFSLMSLAAGIVGLSVTQQRAARRALDAVDTTIALESASEMALLALRRDGVPQAPAWREDVDWEGQTFAVDQFDTAYKLDINTDTQAVLAAARQQPEAERLVEGLASVLPPPAPPAAAIIPSPTPQIRKAPAVADLPPAFSVLRLVDLVTRTQGDAAEEDCLRMLATIGRETSAPLTPEKPAPLIVPRQPLAPNQVIELRVAARDGFGRNQILWRRVRYFGAPQRVFGDHDWRRLTLAQARPRCRPTTS